MKLFGFLTGKGTIRSRSAIGSYFDTQIDEADLIVLINKAISVFQDNPGDNHDQIIDTIKTYRNDEDLALALYRFIPIVYCRLLLPEVTYSDEFVLFKSKSDQKSFLFSTDKLYNFVLTESKKRFSRETAEEKIMPILFHSADFKAINDALKSGSALTDLVCSPSYFLS